MKHPDSVAQRYMKLCEAYLCLNEAFDKLDQSHSRLQRCFKQLFGYFSAAQQALVQLPILQQRIEQSDRRLHSLREELQAKEARLSELIANYDQVCGELDSTKAELLGAQALIEKLEAENAQVLERLSRLTSMEEEVANLAEQLAQANAARQQMEVQNRELERALGDRDQHIYSLQERLAQSEQEMAFLKAQRDEAISRAEQAEASLKAQTEQVQTLRNKLHQAEQQLAVVALNELELLLDHNSINLLQEAEQAAQADAQVLATLPEALAEAEGILLEIDRFILACSEPGQSQAA